MSLWNSRLLSEIAWTPAVGWQAIGKVVQDMNLTSDKLPDWTFGDWGYGSNKLKQLMRNYVNDEEFARVRSILARRGLSKYTSVALSLRGKPKDARSQGWCMLSLVVSRSKESTAIEVQYRTTEAILKFAADVIFLRDYILPTLGVTPNIYRFRFANIALSGAYFPYLIDKMNLIGFLTEIEDNDYEFLIRTTRFLLKACYRKDQYHPFSPERVSHKFLWERGTPQQLADIRRYLEPLHRATGRPLPKDFHDSSYIPKGQRSRQEGYDEEE